MKISKSIVLIYFKHCNLSYCPNVNIYIYINISVFIYWIENFKYWVVNLLPIYIKNIYIYENEFKVF